MTSRVIDTHLHLWDLGRSSYAWLTPELGPLHRDFAPHEAEAELRAAGVDAAVLVQADDTADDTRFMLDVARAHDWVAGVVGWVPLDHEPGTAAALEELAAEPLLRGIRHLVHDDPRDDFFDLPQVRASLGRVADHGLVLDVPDAWPRHLQATARLARDLPQLTVVLDHLGKPPLGGDLGAWRVEFDRLAAAPNSVVKFSGLHLPGAPFTTAVVGHLLDIALEAFGADRIMYGGDWPMSVPHGGYRPTWEVMRACLDRLTPGERDAILGGNAERIYATRRGETG
ncbi:amidohydrolase family protein [Myceligenerans halotolerans]